MLIRACFILFIFFCTTSKGFAQGIDCDMQYHSFQQALNSDAPLFVNEIMPSLYDKILSDSIYKLFTENSYEKIKEKSKAIIFIVVSVDSISYCHRIIKNDITEIDQTKLFQYIKKHKFCPAIRNGKAIDYYMTLIVVQKAIGV